MQQAVYSPDNMGHFGLSYPGYSHFTSPIRRYPDLLTHRVIKALLAGQRYVPSLDDQAVVIGRTQKEHEHAIWEKMGLVLSASERRADEASREVEAWLKCWFVKERVGEDFSGTVTGGWCTSPNWAASTSSSTTPCTNCAVSAPACGIA
ncbi:hypothetical protein G6F32_015462 [Rhizopus arrhizus]|nr:hypothetical protein G6F32_015462 [Rhizopus arrhizus]